MVSMLESFRAGETRLGVNKRCPKILNPETDILGRSAAALHHATLMQVFNRNTSTAGATTKTLSKRHLHYSSGLGFRV